MSLRCKRIRISHHEAHEGHEEFRNYYFSIFLLRALLRILASRVMSSRRFVVKCVVSNLVARCELCASVVNRSFQLCGTIMNVWNNLEPVIYGVAP